MSWNKRRGSVLGPVSVAVIIAAGGCGSTVEIDYASIRGLGTSGGPGGVQVAAVFSNPGLVDPVQGWEDSRRDESLGVQDNGPKLATDEWSQSPRPSLRWQYRGRFVSPNNNSYLYYEPEPDRPRRRRGW